MPDETSLRSLLATTPPALVPDRQFKYSNLGYALLGLVIEAVTHEPYAVAVNRLVLAPLGMSRSLLAPTAPPPGLVPAFDRGHQARPFLPLGVLEPAAGMVTTIGDLAALVAWAADDADSPVMTAGSRREMIRAQGVYPDWKGGPGLGFEIRHLAEGVRIGHAGQAAGYAAKVEVDPATGLGLIILTDIDQGGPGRLIDHGFALLNPALIAARPLPVPVADPAWQKYVGLYQSIHGHSSILITEGRLAWQDPDAPDPAATRIALDPAGPNQFRFLAGPLIGEILEFETDAQGRVRLMRAGGVTDYRQ